MASRGQPRGETNWAMQQRGSPGEEGGQKRPWRSLSPTGWLAWFAEARRDRRRGAEKENKNFFPSRMAPSTLQRAGAR
jgi:hypothetical protein